MSLARRAGEEGSLYCNGALLGGEDFGLVVLELGSGEALGVDEGLLAFVVGGNEARLDLVISM